MSVTSNDDSFIKVWSKCNGLALIFIFVSSKLTSIYLFFEYVMLKAN